MEKEQSPNRLAQSLSVTIVTIINILCLDGTSDKGASSYIQPTMFLLDTIYISTPEIQSLRPVGKYHMLALEDISL
jgi:hypothetical protein